MTAVSAMQCIERGLLSLDQDVTDILHELKDIEILTGFDEAGKPILKKSTKTMTLRWEHDNRSAHSQESSDINKTPNIPGISLPTPLVSPTIYSIPSSRDTAQV